MLLLVLLKRQDTIHHSKWVLIFLAMVLPLCCCFPGFTGFHAGGTRKASRWPQNLPHQLRIFIILLRIPKPFPKEWILFSFSSLESIWDGSFIVRLSFFFTPPTTPSRPSPLLTYIYGTQIKLQEFSMGKRSERFNKIHLPNTHPLGEWKKIDGLFITCSKINFAKLGMDITMKIAHFLADFSCGTLHWLMLQFTQEIFCWWSIFLSGKIQQTFLMPYTWKIPLKVYCDE